MSGRLAGKAAIVFGAGSCGPGWGNGKAAAVQYAREGARIVAVDMNLDAAEETAAIVRDEGNEAVAVGADVSNSDDVKAAVERCVKVYGSLDVLHNNVGICKTEGPVELDEADWDQVMAANVKGMFLTCKYSLPIMEKQGSGVIVNISSLASMRWVGVPWISYSTSKCAVNQFTQTIAIQYARKGIRANAILPGLMNTPMIIEPHRPYYDDLSEMMEKRNERCPSGKMGDAWDVAYASVFLASDEARYINGALLPVDGGLSCVAA